MAGVADDDVLSQKLQARSEDEQIGKPAGVLNKVATRHLAHNVEPRDWPASGSIDHSFDLVLVANGLVRESHGRDQWRAAELLTGRLDKSLVNDKPILVYRVGEEPGQYVAPQIERMV